LDEDILSKPKINALEILAEQIDEIAKNNNLTKEDSLLLFVSIAPVIVTASFRMKHEMQPIEPHKTLGHASNFLWMLHGKMPTANDAQDFETSLILHMDYPGNQSQSALEASIKSGQSISQSLLAALREHEYPRHHGAGEYVWKMIQEIDDISNVTSYLSTLLEQGKRIFGLGHVDFKAIDPRAVVLRDILRRRISGREDDSVYKLVEEVASVGSSLIYEMKGHRLFPNLDLYNVFVYSTLGISAELNTDLFGLARSAGWMAHALENMKIKELE
jgi:citrate synthase